MTGERSTDGAPDQRLDAVVRGHVHGVGFRVWVLRRARTLGISGWVANEAGGTVHCVAEGSESALMELLAALREGPPAAWVERVDAGWAPATGAFPSFQIRPGWHGGD